MNAIQKIKETMKERKQKEMPPPPPTEVIHPGGEVSEEGQKITIDYNNAPLFLYNIAVNTQVSAKALLDIKEELQKLNSQLGDE
jgi:hypothetical protein